MNVLASSHVCPRQQRYFNGTSVINHSLLKDCRSDRVLEAIVICEERVYRFHTAMISGRSAVH